MKSSVKSLLAALAAAAYVIGCFSVVANAQDVRVAQGANDILNRLVNNGPGVIVKDGGSVAPRQIEARGRSAEEAITFAEKAFEKWPQTASANQVVAQSTMPPFIAEINCGFCRKGKEVNIDLWTTQDIELPGVTITWRLLRPGKSFRHAEGDRITYGVAETAPFPGVLSRVVSYVNYSGLIKIPLPNNSDTTPGEHLLDIIIQHWDGRTIQHIRTRFFVSRTADNDSRGADSVDYVIPTKQGGAVLKGAFVAGSRYVVVHMDAQESAGSFSYGVATDTSTLVFGGQVWQLFESGARIAVVNLDTGEHFAAPPSIIKKYGRD